jgi:hypothetical protein
VHNQCRAHAEELTKVDVVGPGDAS